jgi:two-component system NtrC family sensor kinase
MQLLLWQRTPGADEAWEQSLSAIAAVTCVTSREAWEEALSAPDQRWDVCALVGAARPLLEERLLSWRWRAPEAVFVCDCPGEDGEEALWMGLDGALDPAAPLEALEPLIHRRHHRRRGSPPRELLALTSAEDAQILRQILRPAGFTVWLASSAVDALQGLRVQRPPILLVDLNRPRLRGAEVLRAAVRHWPGQAAVALLSEDSLGDKLVVAPREATELLTTPLQPSRVVEVLTGLWTGLALEALSPQERVGGERRCLLLEPSEEDAAALTQKLCEGQGVGFAVTRARSTPQALAALRVGRFDALLVALGEAGVPYEALRQLRAAEPHLPVVALLKEPSDAQIERLLRGHVQDHVDKAHLVGAQLRVRVEQAIERASLRRRTEGLVRDLYGQRADLLALIEQHPDGLLIISQEGRVRFANPRAVAILACSYEGLLGASLSALLLAEGAPEELLRPPAQPRLAEVLRADGAVTPVEVLASSIAWQGEEARLIQLHDISERIAAEEYKARLIRTDHLASVGQLAAGFAHEINNPASFVISNLTMLDRELQDLLHTLTERGALSGAEATNLLDMVEMAREGSRGMERIAAITAALQDFTRMHDHEIELTDVNQVVRAAAEVLRADKRVRLTLREGELPPIVAHKGRLVQVVTNLLLNAMSALQKVERAAPTILIQTASDEVQITICVEDNGCGIAPEHLERIFEPFFTLTTGQGSGLGLSLSAEIVRQHGGQLHIESQYGGWTRATLYLPLESDLRRTPSAASVLAPPLLGEGARHRILLVDDDPLVLKSYVRLLSDEFEVFYTQSAREALSALREGERFEVIISDLMMPDFNGMQLYEAIKAEAPALLPRVVFYTGGVYDPSVMDFLQSVHVPLLTKPVSPEVLVQVIRSLLYEPPSVDPGEDQ